MGQLEALGPGFPKEADACIGEKRSRGDRRRGRGGRGALCVRYVACELIASGVCLVGFLSRQDFSV